MIVYNKNQKYLHKRENWKNITYCLFGRYQGVVDPIPNWEWEGRHTNEFGV